MKSNIYYLRTSAGLHLSHLTNIHYIQGTKKRLSKGINNKYPWPLIHTMWYPNSFPVNSSHI